MVKLRLSARTAFVFPVYSHAPSIADRACRDPALLPSPGDAGYQHSKRRTDRQDDCAVGDVTVPHACLGDRWRPDASAPKGGQAPLWGAPVVGCGPVQ